MTFVYMLLLKRNQKIMSKSLKSIIKKREKAKARRKDFVKRSNINKNVPSVEVVHRVPTFSQKKENGKTVMKTLIDGGIRPEVEHYGYKLVKIKKKVYRQHQLGDENEPAFDANRRRIGMVSFPLIKKYKQKKS